MPKINTYGANASIEENDKLLTYDTGAGATKLTDFETIDSWMKGKLASASEQAAATSDQLLTVKNGVVGRTGQSAVAKSMVEDYAGSSLGGSTRSVKAAIDATATALSTLEQETEDAISDLKDDFDESAESMAPPYSSISTYYVGALVKHGNTVYRCKTTIATPEAWNSSKWEATTLGFEINDVIVGDTSGVIRSWLDAHPEATTTVQDGSLTEAKFTNELKKRILNDYVTPEMFGTTGTGDDSDTIQLAIDYAITNGIKLVLIKSYNTKKTLTITSGINIDGNKYFINGTIDDGPTLQIDCTSEIRGKTISNLGIRNYGSGTNADALLIEGNMAFVSNKISGCNFWSQTGWSLHLSECVAHNLFEANTIQGYGEGALYAECGDANTFTKNMLFGTGIGIYLNTPSYGELNNAIINNTIVNSNYAILIDSGDQTLISNNQIEYNGSADSTNNPSASIYLRGTTRNVAHCNITSNNFGGGTHLNYSIYIKHGNENIISANRFVGVNIADVFVQNGGSSGSTNNLFLDDNIAIGTQHNPRTDSYQPVIVGCSVPKCINGCWHNIQINDSDSTIRVKKTLDGCLIFAPVAIIKKNATESQSVIFTLPVRYRPSNNCGIIAMWNKNYTGLTPINLKIGYNGEVSFLEEQTYTSCELFIPQIIITK